MAQHHHGESWTQRTKSVAPAEELESSDDVDPRQGGFQRAQTSLGATGKIHHAHGSLGVAGHIVHMAGVFVPLIAGELVQDAAKYKKTVRLASIGTALAYEVLYVMHEQKKREEQDARLEACRSR